MALIYAIIEQSRLGQTLSKDQILYATALFDTALYIQRRTITEEQLDLAVLYAKSGEIGLLPYRQTHASSFRPYENFELINLTMQIELLIFSVDTNVNTESIIDMIIKKKPRISSVISETLSDYRQDPNYGSACKRITYWLKDPSVRKEISSYSAEPKYPFPPANSSDDLPF